MVRQASLTSELASLLGADAVLREGARSAFAVDGVEPRAVVAPGSVEHIAETLRYAHRERLAVTPWGGSSHMHIGNLPARYDIALSLGRLDIVTEHEPADLTVTVQAGITLVALQEHLAGAGQMLPLGPFPDARATVGGVLAAAASGPWRHAYGTARDWTIGLRVITADGRITKAGGRVVKNVAGYDLCKLYIGSLGTLGVIVEATFKVVPLPQAQATLALGFDSAGPACALASESYGRGLGVRSAQLLDVGAGIELPKPFALLVELAGSPLAVERSRREIESLAAEAGAVPVGAVADASRPLTLLSPSSSRLVCKLTALPTRLPALVDALASLSPAPRLLAWPVAGILYASWLEHSDPAAALAAVRAAAATERAGVVVEVCPVELKGGLDVFPDVSGPSFDLMRRVKQQFDPEGVLSPGRFLGKL